MSEFISLYVTALSEVEAEKIAHAVVSEKLAACANLFLNVKSIYRWKGNVEEAKECALILKARKDQYEALERRIKELHTYECPCIVATPITAGSKEYLMWLSEQ